MFHADRPMGLIRYLTMIVETARARGAALSDLAAATRARLLYAVLPTRVIGPPDPQHEAGGDVARSSRMTHARAGPPAHCALQSSTNCLRLRSSARNSFS